MDQLANHDTDAKGVLGGGPASDSDFAWLNRGVQSLLPAAKVLSTRKLNRVSKKCRDNPTLQGLCESIASFVAASNLEAARWRAAIDECDLPCVVVTPDQGIGLVYAQGTDQSWHIESPSGRMRIEQWPEETVFVPLRVAVPKDANATASGLLQRVFNEDRAWLYQVTFASLIGSVLALATSLYSMQVYDRVISTGGVPTLVVLCIGVGIAIVIELAIKIAKSLISTDAVHDIDVKFGTGVFDRLLQVRMDQFPQNVGTLAAQVRGFETVRAFKIAATQYLVGDAPFALFFVFVIFLIGGVTLAAIPAVALIVAVVVGFAFKRAIQKHANREFFAGNRRQGLLVDAIHGAETLKSSGGGWKMLRHWGDLSRMASQEAQELKRLSDVCSFLGGAIQQIGYVAIVTAGAWLAISGSELTVGSIIACSIISGRILTPINALPGLMMQWGQSKVALESLEKLFELQCENHGLDLALMPSSVSGSVKLSHIEFAYPGQPQPQSVRSFSIAPGERVAVVGAIGAGKTTLLKMIAGLCKPQRGNVSVDGLDVFQLDPERRSELIGYLPQKNRLFAGTLRDNLLLGQFTHSDEELLEIASITGLSDFIGSHQEGLDLRIHEGGQGLSGGQAQLVAFTRLLLANPQIWLLDEPTASMDDVAELRCLKALDKATADGRTVVLVTHKMRLLELVDRIVVLTNQGIALDGPRDEVLSQLQRRPDGAAHNDRQSSDKSQKYPARPAAIAGLTRRNGAPSGGEKHAST